MIASGTFLIALLFLSAIAYQKSRELNGAERIAPSARGALDRKTDALFLWLETHATPDALWDYCKHISAHVAHYMARVMAKIAHSVEYQARTVVHKTSKRVRKGAHYLEEVTNEGLDSGEKKGNNTASEKSE